VELQTCFVDMAPLKEFAIRRLPPGSTARELILAENQSIPAGDFLVKIDVWMRLVRRELDQ